MAIGRGTREREVEDSGYAQTDTRIEGFGVLRYFGRRE